MYLPKNAIGFEASWPNSKRYLPPTRTSASQESRDTPVDFGAHHRLSRSGLVHASNTMRAGPLKVRVTTSSRLDFPFHRRAVLHGDSPKTASAPARIRVPCRAWCSAGSWPMRCFALRPERHAARRKEENKMNAKIFRIILEVAGGDAALDFYAQLLDPKARKVGGGRIYFDCGAVILALLEKPKPLPLPGRIYFAWSGPQ